MSNLIPRITLALFGAGLPLLAVYGETVTVETKLTTIISPGWVITSQQAMGSTSYNAHFPTRCYMTLTDLGGAPLGAEHDILGQSPIPAGWEIISSSGTSGLEKFSYNIRHRIRKVQASAAASSTQAVTHAQEVTYDIAGIDWKRQDLERRLAAEANRAESDARAAAYAKAYEDERQAILERREPTTGAERQGASERGELTVVPRSYTR